MAQADYTINDLTEILGRCRKSVQKLIDTGLLTAYDASPAGSYRQWRVTRDSLDQFRTKHAAVRPTQKSVKRKTPATVKEYF